MIVNYAASFILGIVSTMVSRWWWVHRAQPWHPARAVVSWLCLMSYRFYAAGEAVRHYREVRDWCVEHRRLNSVDRQSDLA